MLGVAWEEQDRLASEIAEGIEAAAREKGVPSIRVTTADDEAKVESLVAVGHPRFYPDLLRRPASARRALWYGEPLRPPDRDAARSRLLGALPWHRALHVVLSPRTPLGRLRRRPVLERFRDEAAMEREWRRNRRQLLAARPAFDVVAVTSLDFAAGARALGLTVKVVPFGYAPEMAGHIVAPEAGPRDIQTLVLGTAVGDLSRRARILDHLRVAMKDGPSLHVAEAGVYAAARTALLRRTRVVADVHRVALNPPSIRFILATAAGAALVSETSRDTWPLEPGRHFIQAPGDRLSEAVLELLADEHRRRVLVRSAQELLRDELAMAKCLDAVVSEAG